MSCYLVSPKERFFLLPLPQILGLNFLRILKISTKFCLLAKIFHFICRCWAMTFWLCAPLNSLHCIVQVSVLPPPGRTVQRCQCIQHCAPPCPTPNCPALPLISVMPPPRRHSAAISPKGTPAACHDAVNWRKEVEEAKMLWLCYFLTCALHDTGVAPCNTSLERPGWVFLYNKFIFLTQLWTSVADLFQYLYNFIQNLENKSRIFLLKHFHWIWIRTDYSNL